MSTWAEQRRADREASRAQDRLDTEADRKQARLDADAAAKREREAQAAQDKRNREAKDAREKAKAKRAAWRSKHAVELLIYPLAFVSAVMAIPAMAFYGWDVYGNPTGLALPLISELGVWAFSIAILVSRRRFPDRPTGMLSAGVVIFGGVAFGLNFAHGLHDGLIVGAVMAIVSVAGVVAHQLAVASPPRSRAERAQARIARHAERRINRTRRIAARRAIVELAADGTARLVYTPGLYAPRRGRLRTAAGPDTVGMSTEPVGSGTDWDTELARIDLSGGPVEPALNIDRPLDSTTEADQHESDGESPPAGGGVALADPPAPVDPTPRPTTRGGRPIDPHARRKLTPAQALTAGRRIARKNGKPVTGEQLRTALGIGAKAARDLRDRINAELYPDGAA